MRTLVVVAVLGTIGCSTNVSFMPTNKAPRALQARAVDEVELFTTTKPERSHVEVGLIEVQQQSLSVDDEKAVMNKLRAEAAKQGCDGLVITGTNDAVQMIDGDGTTLKGYRGTCIVYKEMPAADEAIGGSGDEATMPEAPAPAPAPATDAPASAQPTPEKAN